MIRFFKFLTQRLQGKRTHDMSGYTADSAVSSDLTFPPSFRQRTNRRLKHREERGRAKFSALLLNFWKLITKSFSECFKNNFLSVLKIK